MVFAGANSRTAEGIAKTQLRFVHQSEAGKGTTQLSGFALNYGNAVSAPLHKELSALRSFQAPDVNPPECRGEDLVARGLPLPHALDCEVVGQSAGRSNFHPIFEHGQPDPASPYGVIPVHHGVDQCLEEYLDAVLGNILARRILARSNAHVADSKSQGLLDLLVEGSPDFLGVKLPGRSVTAPVTGSGHIAVGKPTFRRTAAEENAGDSGPNRSILVRRQEAHLLQSPFWGQQLFGTEQRFPESFFERSESGPFHRLLVEPKETGLSASLGKVQPLLSGHLLLGTVAPG